MHGRISTIKIELTPESRDVLLTWLRRQKLRAGLAKLARGSRKSELKKKGYKPYPSRKSDAKARSKLNVAKAFTSQLKVGADVLSLTSPPLQN